MRVRIDPAGDNQFSGRVDYTVRVHIERFSDYRYGLVFYQDISAVVVNGGDDAARFDQCFHSQTELNYFDKLVEINFQIFLQNVN